MNEEADREKRLARRRVAHAKWRTSDKGKAYLASDERKAACAKYKAKYLVSDKGRAVLADRAAKEDVKERNRAAWLKFSRSDRGRAAQARNLEKRRSEPERRQRHWELQRSAMLLRKYGITLDDFRMIVQLQGSKCAACGDLLPSWEFGDARKHDGRHPVVDHCHRSDGSHAVRGILHATCNQACGMVHDDPEIARRLARYLERTRHARPMRPGAHQLGLGVG